MSKITDQNYLKDYSRQFAKKICSGFFQDKEHIKGEEIAELSPCRQLNLLIIKELFGRWQSETAKLRQSPYFDYSEPKVEEAFDTFKNALSNAIKVNREHVEPLVEVAVAETILLAMEPEKFFKTEIDKSKDSPQEYFSKNKRYVKWRSEIWQSLQHQTEQGSDEVGLHRELNRWLGKDSDQEGLPLLEQLEKTLPINHSRLFPNEGERNPLPALELENKPSPGSSSEEEDAPKLESSYGGIDPALAWARFEKAEYGLMQGSVNQLSKDIAINQRFMFTKSLFAGDPERMHEALEKIDDMDNFMDAVEMLNEFYVQDLDWDVNSEEVHELLQMIFRKFESEK
jgi:hypothetical protein